MNRHLYWSLSTVVMMLGFSLVGLYLMYPYRPKDLAGWGVLVSLSAPLVLLIEGAGTALLGRGDRSISRSPAVMVLGVVGAIFIAGLFLFVWPLAKPYLVKW